MADPLSEKEMAEFLVIWRERKLLNLTAVPYWTDRLIATLDLRYNAAIEDAAKLVEDTGHDDAEWFVEKIRALAKPVREP